MKNKINFLFFIFLSLLSFLAKAQEATIRVRTSAIERLADQYFVPAVDHYKPQILNWAQVQSREASRFMITGQTETLLIQQEKTGVQPQVSTSGNLPQQELQSEASHALSFQRIENRSRDFIVEQSGDGLRFQTLPSQIDLGIKKLDVDVSEFNYKDASGRSATLSGMHYFEGVHIKSNGHFGVGMDLQFDRTTEGLRLKPGFVQILLESDIEFFLQDDIDKAQDLVKDPSKAKTNKEKEELKKAQDLLARYNDPSHMVAVLDRAYVIPAEIEMDDDLKKALSISLIDLLNQNKEVFIKYAFKEIEKALTENIQKFLDEQVNPRLMSFQDESLERQLGIALDEVSRGSNGEYLARLSPASVCSEDFSLHEISVSRSTQLTQPVQHDVEINVDEAFANAAIRSGLRSGAINPEIGVGDGLFTVDHENGEEPQVRFSGDRVTATFSGEYTNPLLENLPIEGRARVRLEDVQARVDPTIQNGTFGFRIDNIDQATLALEVEKDGKKQDIKVHYETVSETPDSINSRIVIDQRSLESLIDVVDVRSIEAIQEKLPFRMVEEPKIRVLDDGSFAMNTTLHVPFDSPLLSNNPKIQVIHGNFMDPLDPKKPLNYFDVKLTVKMIPEMTEDGRLILNLPPGQFIYNSEVQALFPGPNGSSVRKRFGSDTVDPQTGLSGLAWLSEKTGYSNVSWASWQLKLEEGQRDVGDIITQELLKMTKAKGPIVAVDFQNNSRARETLQYLTGQVAMKTGHEAQFQNFAFDKDKNLVINLHMNKDNERDKVDPIAVLDVEALSDQALGATQDFAEGAEIERSPSSSATSHPFRFEFVDVQARNGHLSLGADLANRDGQVHPERASYWNEYIRQRGAEANPEDFTQLQQMFDSVRGDSANSQQIKRDILKSIYVLTARMKTNRIQQTSDQIERWFSRPGDLSFSQSGAEQRERTLRGFQASVSGDVSVQARQSRGSYQSDLDPANNYHQFLRYLRENVSKQNDPEIRRLMQRIIDQGHPLQD